MTKGYQASEIMQPPRRLRVLTPSELGKLSVQRLLAYRKKALSLENSAADSDYADEVADLDQTYIWFKEDPRWHRIYEDILQALAEKQ